jgi:hypothetical protein
VNLPKPKKNWAGSESISWKTGLKEAVMNVSIVINPSLWSSPVEGALLKSIKYNGCVAILPIEYSFQKEIPTDVVIHLENKVSESVVILENVFNSISIIEEYKKQSSQWFKPNTKSTHNKFDKFLV